MQCRYIAAFAARGITHEDGELIIHRDSKVSIILTKNSADLLRDADRAEALRHLMLKGVFHAESFDHGRLDCEAAAIVKRRENVVGRAPQLVVTVNRAVEPSLDGPRVDQASFSLYWDAVDKNKVKNEVRPVAYRALAAVMVSSRGSPAIDHLLEAVYLVGPEN
jgi:hypothetical protein